MRYVPREAAEAHDHPDARQQFALAQQPWKAVVALGGRRPVRGRRAAHRRGHEAVAQGEAVVAGDRGGLVGQPRSPQRSEQPVAGAVAREDPSRAVAAVRGGREPEDQDPSARVAEAGHGPTPVLLAGERASLDASDLLAPGDEPRTAPALRDLRLEPGQLGGAHGDAASSIPSIIRSMTGARSRASAGSPSRTWRETSSVIAPTTASASRREAKRGPRPRSAARAFSWSRMSAKALST